MGQIALCLKTILLNMNPRHRFGTARAGCRCGKASHVRPNHSTRCMFLAVGPDRQFMRPACLHAPATMNSNYIPAELDTSRTPKQHCPESSVCLSVHWGNTKMSARTTVFLLHLLRSCRDLPSAPESSVAPALQTKQSLSLG